MSSGEELYKIIVAANLELQNLLSLLLSLYAEEHALNNPHLPGTNALHALLSTYITPVKQAVKGYAAKKVFTTDERKAIHQIVEPKKLDSSLILSILLKVDQILGIDRRTGPCARCIGKCCANCSHVSPTCNKCSSVKKKGKCQHKCVACNSPSAQCEEYKEICCLTCGICIHCNKVEYEVHVKAILSGSQPTQLSCDWFKFTRSLEIAEYFRNLFGHLTVKSCTEFVNNGTVLNPEFKICGTTKSLEEYVNFIFTNLVAHVESKFEINFPARVEEVKRTIGNIRCVFKHGESLQHYLADKSSKIKEIFDQRSTIIEETERSKSELVTHIKAAKEEIIEALKVPETISNSTKAELFSRLNKGFVLKLPLQEDEDVIVEYRSCTNAKGWIRANPDKKRDGDVVYLRVEGLPSTGDFDVKVKILCDDDLKEEAGQMKLEIIDAIRCTTKIGNITIVAPPNGSSCEAFCLWADKENCIEISTKLAIKVVNDEKPSGKGCGIDVKLHVAKSDENDSDDTECDGSNGGKSGDESDESDGSVSDDDEEIFRADEFSDKGLQYFDRNFGKLTEDVIDFPPFSMIEDDVMKSVAEKFKDLLSREPGLKLILSNYDDSKFSQFVKDVRLKKIFKSYQASSSSNRLLLFYSQLSTVINARVVTSKSDIHQEITNCVNDLNLFCCTFKSAQSSQSRLILSALIVCPHISRKELEEDIQLYFNKGKKSCENLKKYFFITKDELDENAISQVNNRESMPKETNLAKWWTEVFKKKLVSVCGSFKNRRDPNELCILFQRISGQCMATIACCDANNKSMLPSLSTDEQKQILTLLLNNSQLRAISGPEKHKLVYGPYGCGKTVVADALVRKIYEDSIVLQTKCLIMYAIQDDYSLLEVRNRRFVDDLKRDVQKNSKRSEVPSYDLIDLSSGTFQSLMQVNCEESKSLLSFVKAVVQLKRKDFDSINLIIDEVDRNSIVGQNDVEELKKLLESIDYFVIIPRSGNLRWNLLGQENTESNDLYQLGLYPYHLESVMRNTVEIVNLAESCQNTVQESNNLVQYQSTMLQLTNTDFTIGMNNPTENLENQIQRSLLKQKDDAYKTMVWKSQQSKIIKEKTKTLNIATTEQNQSEKFVSVNLLSAAKHIDRKRISSSTSLVIRSSFHACVSGNHVTRGRPNLIYMPKSFDLKSEKAAKVLSIVVDKLCLNTFNPSLMCNGDGKSLQSPVFICNELDEVKIVYYALEMINRLRHCCILYIPQLRTRYFSLKDKEPVFDAVLRGDKVLIADNGSIRGMESRHVITFINPLERLDRHILPETITRANVKLDIICFPVNKCEKNETSCVKNIIDNWLDKNADIQTLLVDVTEVIVSNSKNADDICSKGKHDPSSEKTPLIINLHSRAFQKYGEELGLSFEDFLKQKENEFSIGKANIEREFYKRLNSLNVHENVTKKDIRFSQKSKLNVTKCFNVNVYHAGLIIGSNESEIQRLQQIPGVFNISIDIISLPTDSTVTVSGTAPACNEVYDQCMKITRNATIHTTLFGPNRCRGSLIVLKSHDNGNYVPTICPDIPNVYTLSHFESNVQFNDESHSTKLNDFHSFSVKRIEETFQMALNCISPLSIIRFDVIPGKIAFLAQGHDNDIKFLQRKADGSLDVSKHKMKHVYIPSLSMNLKNKIFQSLVKNHFACINAESPDSYTNVYLLAGAEKVPFYVRMFEEQPATVLRIMKNKRKVCNVTMFSEAPLDTRASIVSMESSTDLLSDHVRNILNAFWKDRDEHGNIQTPYGKADISVTGIKQIAARYTWIKKVNETDVLQLNVKEVTKDTTESRSTHHTECLEIKMRIRTVEFGSQRTNSAESFVNDYLLIIKEWEKICQMFF